MDAENFIERGKGALSLREERTSVLFMSQSEHPAAKRHGEESEEDPASKAARMANLSTGVKSDPAKFAFNVLCCRGRARVGVLKTPHSEVETPVFMPVGTQGTMKLLALDCRIILANTYHLAHRPGYERVRVAGGVHRMMNWPRSLLTDSGGFQMVSLSKLMELDEDGVRFESPHTKEITELPPEQCIHVQEALGADIMMQLDHVVHTLTTGPIVEEAMQRSIRWLDRCAASQTRDDQTIFPIVQGGLNLELRKICAEEMSKRAQVGIAIGGLSGGEDKSSFWRVVAACCEWLPPHLPRYVMGVGFAVDLVVCSLLGADMFDCVFPTRTARFGTALVRRGGELHLKQKKFEKDFTPIDSNCDCNTCKTYTRAYIHSIFSKETVACHLLSVHNLAHHLRLMRDVREAISESREAAFLHQFLVDFYRAGQAIPAWVNDAAKHVGITLDLPFEEDNTTTSSSS